MKVVTIGRSSENNVTINNSFVGRHHCQIVQHDNGTFSIVDLDSKNGTFVNGQRVNGEAPLRLGDSVRIAQIEVPWQQYFSSAGKKSKNWWLWPTVATAVTAVVMAVVTIVLLSQRFSGWHEKDIYYSGAYPPVSQVVYVQDGNSYSVEAVQGQIIVYFSDEVLHREAIRAIKHAGGKVLAQIPNDHYYLVGTNIGGESSFMQKIQNTVATDFVFPNAVSYTCAATPYVMDDFTDKSDGATHGEMVSYTMQECGLVSVVKHYEENVDGSGLKWSEIVQDLNNILSDASEEVSPVINMSFGVPLKVAEKHVYWKDAPDSAQSNYRKAYIQEMKYLLKKIRQYDDKDFVIIKSTGNDGVKNFEKDILIPLYKSLSKKQRALMDKHVILVAAEDSRWREYSNELEEGVNHQWVTKVDISDLKYKGKDIHGTSFSAPRTSCFISTASEKFKLKPTEVLQYVRKATEQAPGHILTQEFLEQTIEKTVKKENSENKYQSYGCLKYRLVKDHATDVECLELHNTCNEDILVTGYLLNAIASHGDDNTLDFETIVHANGTEYIDGFIENKCTITSVEKVKKELENPAPFTNSTSQQGIPASLVGTKWHLHHLYTLEFIDSHHAILSLEWHTSKESRTYYCYYDSKKDQIVLPLKKEETYSLGSGVFEYKDGTLLEYTKLYDNGGGTLHICRRM